MEKYDCRRCQPDHLTHFQPSLTHFLEENYFRDGRRRKREKYVRGRRMTKRNPQARNIQPSPTDGESNHRIASTTILFRVGNFEAWRASPRPLRRLSPFSGPIITSISSSSFRRLFLRRLFLFFTLLLVTRASTLFECPPQQKPRNSPPALTKERAEPCNTVDVHGSTFAFKDPSHTNVQGPTGLGLPPRSAPLSGAKKRRVASPPRPQGFPHPDAQGAETPARARGSGARQTLRRACRS